MTPFSSRAPAVRSFFALVLAAVLLAPASHALAQSQPNNSGGFLDRLFSGDNNPPGAPAGNTQTAQADLPNLLVRVDRLEDQIRRLTGVIEQLQFSNQQLTQQLQRMQEDTEYRFQELGSKGRPRSAPPPSRQAPSPQQQMAPARQPGPAPDRRSDAFNPQQHPDAPGAPRPLGGMPGGNPNIAAANPATTGATGEGEPLIGAPGGRPAGAPLDLSTLAGKVASDPTLQPGGTNGQLPAPPPRNPNATGTRLASTAPPTQTPQDLYDLGYGYVLHKDYALAEQTLKRFVQAYPSDRRIAEAEYWLGESLYQRQRYRDAAEAFLTVSTKYETAAKAPEALLRLGQSLAALGEKEAACASLSEVKRKFPHAPLSVKRGAERELKRAHC